MENLSSESKFLEEYEEEFKDRYTENDKEFMEVFNAETADPPIIDNWRTFNNYGRRGLAEKRKFDHSHGRNSYDRGNHSRRYQDRGYQDRGYQDRGYQDRGYQDRGYQDRGYQDRGYQDRGYQRGYQDRSYEDMGSQGRGYGNYPKRGRY